MKKSVLKFSLFLLIFLFSTTYFTYAFGNGDIKPLSFVSCTLEDGSNIDGPNGIELQPKFTLLFDKNVIDMLVWENNKKCISLSSDDNINVPIDVSKIDETVDFERRQQIFVKPSNALNPDKTYHIYISPNLTAKNGVATLGGTTEGKGITITFKTKKQEVTQDTTATATTNQDDTQQDGEGAADTQSNGEGAPVVTTNTGESSTTSENTTTATAEPGTTNENTTTATVEPGTTNENTTTATAEPGTTDENTTTATAEPDTTNENTTTATAEPSTTNENTTTATAEPGTTNENATTVTAEPSTVSESTTIAIAESSTTSESTTKAVYQKSIQENTLEKPKAEGNKSVEGSSKPSEDVGKENSENKKVSQSEVLMGKSTSDDGSTKWIYFVAGTIISVWMVIEVIFKIRRIKERSNKPLV